MPGDLIDLPALRADASATAWCGLEERYEQGRYDGSGGVDTVRHTAGELPVLVCAGHAVTHLRNGHRKPVDLATGGLAELVATVTGAHALTVTGLPLRDPNFDDGGTFKDTLHGLAPQMRAVVDLHGMRDDHGPDVCLGRGARPDQAMSVVEALHSTLTDAGFTVWVDDPFRADLPTTVTSTAQAAGAAAVQVELARRVRRPWDDDATSVRLVDALARAVTRL